jgi:transcription termination factor Rho
MRGDALEYTEQVLKLLKNTKNNEAFIANLKNLNLGPNGSKKS